MCVAVVSWSKSNVLHVDTAFLTEHYSIDYAINHETGLLTTVELQLTTHV